MNQNPHKLEYSSPSREGEKASGEDLVLRGGHTGPGIFQRRYFFAAFVGFGMLWAGWIYIPRPQQMHRGPGAYIPPTMRALLEIDNALHSFQIETGRLPTAAEGLQILVTDKYLPTIPKDEWGHPIVYDCPSSQPGVAARIISSGPDGILGTRDDESRELLQSDFPPVAGRSPATQP
jgi:hypothetical protein